MKRVYLPTTKPEAMVERKLLFIAFALLFVLNTQPLAAENGAGRISGHVADSTGRPIGDLTIVVRNVASGAEHQAKTDDNGTFTIADLEPGRYSVQNQSGAPAATTTGQATVGADSTTNLTIVRRDSASPIEVKAEALVSDSGTAPIRGVYDDNQVQLLPQPNALGRGGQYYGAYNLSLLNEGVTNGNV